MQSHLTGLRTTLESGVPTARNKTSGHDQGVTPITVFEQFAQLRVAPGGGERSVFGGIGTGDEVVTMRLEHRRKPGEMIRSFARGLASPSFRFGMLSQCRTRTRADMFD